MASPRFALHTLATPEHKVIISQLFGPIRHFGKKNKKCFVIHTLSTYLSTFRYCLCRARHFTARSCTKLHEVSISCNSGHVCESKQLHNTLRAAAGRARASACVAPQRAKADTGTSTHYLKGAYADTTLLSKMTRFAKIREAEFSKTAHFAQYEIKLWRAGKKEPCLNAQVLRRGSSLKINIACKVKFYLCNSFFHSVKNSAFAFLFAFGFRFVYDIVEFF